MKTEKRRVLDEISLFIENYEGEDITNILWNAIYLLQADSNLCITSDNIFTLKEMSRITRNLHKIISGEIDVIDFVKEISKVQSRITFENELWDVIIGLHASEDWIVLPPNNRGNIMMLFKDFRDLLNELFEYMKQHEPITA